LADKPPKALQNQLANLEESTLERLIAHPKDGEHQTCRGLLPRTRLERSRYAADASREWFRHRVLLEITQSDIEQDITAEPGFAVPACCETDIGTFGRKRLISIT
jgi:hypothetical protein